MEFTQSFFSFQACLFFALLLVGVVAGVTATLSIQYVLSIRKRYKLSKHHVRDLVNARYEMDRLNGLDWD